MHVPWGWVKQRPHYLAEELSKQYDVEVVYRKMYGVRRQLTSVQTPIHALQELFVIPLERFRFIWNLNCRLIGWQLRKRFRDCHAVWLTHPQLFEMIEGVLPKELPVIYDCMDDALEFPAVRRNPALRESLLAGERKLVARSSIIFTSSVSLQRTIAARHGIQKELTVIPNAISLEDEPELPPLRSDIAGALQRQGKKLIYLGTVSEWFDFATVLNALAQFPDITVLLFGPSEIPIPPHERLFHFGPVEHGNVFTIMAAADILIMPFKLNDLVLGVDPVKLYEYIYSAKPILAVDYPEARKFSDYVYLYRGSEEFCRLVDACVKGELFIKRPAVEYHRFAADNTWQKRATVLMEYVSRLIG